MAKRNDKEISRFKAKTESRSNLSWTKLLLISLSVLQFGCSIDGSIQGVLAELPSLPVFQLNRKSPDFIPAEVVTTSSGHVVRGVIGEVSQKVTTSSGYVVEAIFYE